MQKKLSAGLFFEFFVVIFFVDDADYDCGADYDCALEKFGSLSFETNKTRNA